MKLTKLSLILLSLTLIADCSSPNPAAPPAPPAELPSFLTIPSSVTINVDEITSSSGSALMARLVGPGGPFSTDITFGGDQVNQENVFVDGILGPLHAFTIPVTKVTNHFEGDTTISGATVHIKMDFSDFDFDNDGKTEGCSGNTAALPICVRVWGDNIKILSGVFTAFPTNTNAGAGRLKEVAIDTHSGVEVGSQVTYSRTDPANLSTEISYGLGSPGPDPSAPPTLLLAAHTLATQTGPEGHTVKTVFVSATTDLGGGTTSTGQYVGRFKDAADFWSGTVDLENPSSPRTFSDQCAQISTGTGVDLSDCQNLGIDVDGLGFIDFLNPADIQQSNDFPATPTF